MSWNVQETSKEGEHDISINENKPQESQANSIKV